MKKIGNDTFTFPLGAGTIWARFAIDAPALATDAYTAQYFAVPYSNTTSMAASPSPVLNNVSSVEYWTCNRNSGTSNVKVKLYWENAARSGTQGYSPDLVVASWNSTAWENAGQSAITGTSPGNVTSNTVSAFSTFTFGSLSSGSPLPIVLLEFNANANDDQQVDLTWATATETNNDFFRIERTTDGVSFETVAMVDGSGNSTQNLNYATIDAHPYSGVSYYRLAQIDFNGMQSYSEIIAVNIESTEVIGTEFSFGVYPNPGNGQDIHLVLNAAKGQELAVSIIDAFGKEFAYEVITATEDGNVAYAMPQQSLAPGMYFISILTKEKRYSQKLIVE
jgi:hypothetical protein